MPGCARPARPPGSGRRHLQRQSASVADLGVVGTRSWAHHVVMNEVDDPGQEPTDNPQRWSAKWFRETDDSPSSSRPSGPHPGDDVTPAAPARPGGSSARAPRDYEPARPGGSSAQVPRDYEPARPGGSSARPDMPVLVRIVWDAGISSPVTRGLRQDERDWFRSLVRPDSDARKVLDVQDAGFTLSAGGGFVVDSPGLPQIAVRKTADAIYVLLDRAPRFPAAPARVVPAAPARVVPAAPARVVPAAPARVVPAAPARPDTPVRVRLVWDARIRSPVTRELGQAGQDLFRALVNPDPGAREVPDVQDADSTLSAGDGFVVNSPALPRIAVGKTADAINVLLVPARPHPFPPVKKIRPFDEPGPFAPVRKLGFDFGP